MIILQKVVLSADTKNNTHASDFLSIVSYVRKKTKYKLKIFLNLFWVEIYVVGKNRLLNTIFNHKLLLNVFKCNIIIIHNAKLIQPLYSV